MKRSGQKIPVFTHIAMLALTQRTPSEPLAEKVVSLIKNGCFVLLLKAFPTPVDS